ncbi:hypothetical protein Gotur_034557, partial [Gossypium turneri]
MASLNVYSVLVVLFLTCGAAMAMKENDQIIKENNCETKMGLPCVLEAFTSIFEIGSISIKCCGELVVLGKVCHSQRVWFAVMELKTRIKKYFEGYEEALPSVLEAILRRKLARKHEETDDELMDELEVQPRNNVEDEEFESDFTNLYSTDDEEDMLSLDKLLL